MATIYPLRFCRVCGNRLFSGTKFFCSRDCQIEHLAAEAEARAPSQQEIRERAEAIQRTWKPWEEIERRVIGKPRPLELEPIRVLVG